MGLQKCEDCGGTVSSRARSCPHCGAPVSQDAEEHAAGTPSHFDVSTANQLSELNAKMVDFQRNYPNCINGRGNSPLFIFGISVIVCLAIATAIVVGIFHHDLPRILKSFWESSAGDPNAWLKHNDRGTLLALYLLFLAVGFVMGLIGAVYTYAHNARCDEYDALLARKRSILQVKSAVEAKSVPIANASDKIYQVAEDEKSQRMWGGVWWFVGLILSILLISFGIKSCKQGFANQRERVRKVWFDR